MMQMVRRLSLIVFLVLVSKATPLFAQSDRVVDVIVLKDGSVLVGEFVNVTDTSYLFNIASVDSIHVNKGNVSSIDFGVKNYDARSFKPRIRRLTKRVEKTYKDEGMILMADFGMISGEEVHWHASLTIGKRLSSQFYIGLQGGKENVHNAQPFIWQTDGVWPIGIYGRYYPKLNKLRPYFSTRLGYGFIDDKFNTQKSGGLNILPGIGLHFPSRSRFGLHISLHQYFQKTQGSSEVNIGEPIPIIVTYDQWYNRTVFKVGIEF
jgi:hypothetical protein